MKTLIEVQAAAIEAEKTNPLLHPDKNINRKRRYYQITYLYAEMLRLYVACYPAEEPDRSIKNAQINMADKVWEKILSLFMIALWDEGFVWHDEMQRKRLLSIPGMATKVDSVMAVMSYHMQDGLRAADKIRVAINHHLWLGYKIGLNKYIQRHG